MCNWTIFKDNKPKPYGEKNGKEERPNKNNVVKFKAAWSEAETECAERSVRCNRVIGKNAFIFT